MNRKYDNLLFNDEKKKNWKSPDINGILKNSAILKISMSFGDKHQYKSTNAVK